jgi:hypothetical protein
LQLFAEEACSLRSWDHRDSDLVANNFSNLQPGGWAMARPGIHGRSRGRGRETPTRDGKRGGLKGRDHRPFRKKDLFF